MAVRSGGPLYHQDDAEDSLGLPDRGMVRRAEAKELFKAGMGKEERRGEEGRGGKGRGGEEKRREQRGK